MTQTFAPSRANATAMSRPRPEPPPVIHTVLPAKRLSLFKRVSGFGELATQIQRQREDAPVGYRIVKEILSAQTAAVLLYRAFVERREIDSIAASNECPIVIERRQVGVERCNVAVIAAQGARHLRVQRHVVESGGAGL